MADRTARKREMPYAAGSRLGQYEVLAELGRGGMGIVYRARDLRLGREVALKCPWPALAGEPDRRRRFLREVRAAARLSHPHIVPVYDVFEADDIPWLVMQLVEGETLRQRIERDGPLDTALVLRYGEHLTAALQAAHARRVLHRDVNPNNVLLTREGHALLADFGLARVLPGATTESASTGSGPITAGDTGVGTPGYMSPEAVLGKPVDERSDIFSLGAVLYNACTGQAPFSAPTYPEVLDAVLHREPEPIGRYTYEVPLELERIVRKALAKRPEERYQRTDELLADLRALHRRFDSGSSPGDPRSAVTTVTPAPRRRQLNALALVAVATGVAVLLFGWRSGWLEREKPLKLGVPRQVTTAPGWEAEPALSPDGGLIAYVSEESGNPDIWLIDAHGGRPLRLTDNPAPDRHPSWFPDGSALAYASDRGGRVGIWKVPRLGGSPTMVLADASDPAVSPDGQRLAFRRANAAGNGRIHVASMADPAATERTLTGDAHGFWDHVSPAWSPDGRTIAYADFRDLWLVPADGGEPRRLTTDSARSEGAAWSASGRYLFFSSFREGTQALWRIGVSGRPLERLTAGTGPEWQPSTTRDGSRLAYTTFVADYDLVLRDLETGSESRVTGPRAEDNPALAPDGSTIYFVSDRQAGRYDLWAQALRGRRPDGVPRRLTDHPGSVACPAVSPDGKWIAYFRVVEGRRDIWCLPTAGGEARPLLDGVAAEIQPAFSPDGKQIAFVSDRDGRFHVWIAGFEDGRIQGPERPLSSGESNDFFPSWSPDGTRIAMVRVAAGASEAWVAPSDGAPAWMATRGATATMARFAPGGRDLLVSGTWGGKELHLRRVSGEGGEAKDLEPRVELGVESGLFDVSQDGLLLVFVHEEQKGDIWVLDGGPGWY